MALIVPDLQFEVEQFSRFHFSQQIQPAHPGFRQFDIQPAANGMPGELLSKRGMGELEELLKCFVEPH